jgi:hypothetical protein
MGKYEKEIVGYRSVTWPAFNLEVQHPPAPIGTDGTASRPVCAYKKTAIPSMMELSKHLITKE